MRRGSGRRRFLGAGVPSDRYFYIPRIPKSLERWQTSVPGLAMFQILVRAPCHSPDDAPISNASRPRERPDAIEARVVASEGPYRLPALALGGVIALPGALFSWKAHLHSAWIGEHHFAGLGVLSCPDLIRCALKGTAVAHPPWVVQERLKPIADAHLPRVVRSATAGTKTRMNALSPKKVNS